MMSVCDHHEFLCVTDVLVQLRFASSAAKDDVSILPERTNEGILTLYM